MIMDYLREIFDKKRIWLLISAGISLFLFFVVVFTGVKLSNSQQAQHAATRWANDKDFAQVSAYFSEISNANIDTVKEIRYKIEEKLNTDSISAANSNARRWIDAYCAQGEISIISERDTVKVKAFGVGGDFFVFNPLNLICGAYFNGDDMNKDYVIIDDETAWILYGSSNVVGKQVIINDTPHIITAVYKRDDSHLDKLAGNNETTVFVSYETLCDACGVDGINVYEALMPNELTGYALKALKDGITISENRYDALENTHRFNWKQLVKMSKGYGFRSMNAKSVIFPYWENMARGMENILFAMTWFAMVLISYTLGILIYVFGRMWKRRRIHKEDVKDFVERKIEKYRANRKKKEEEGDYI